MFSLKSTGTRFAFTIDIRAYPFVFVVTVTVLWSQVSNLWYCTCSVSYLPPLLSVLSREHYLSHQEKHILASVAQPLLSSPTPALWGRSVTGERQTTLWYCDSQHAQLLGNQWWAEFSQPACMRIKILKRCSCLNAKSYSFPPSHEGELIRCP